MSSTSSAVSSHSPAHSSASGARSPHTSVESNPPSTNPSAPPPIPTPAVATVAQEALRAAYTIAMPSPVRKTASRKALAAENEQLRNLLRAAGVELEKDQAQMALMDHENANIRRQLHAKKNKPKRTYNTGHARLMTSEEMQQALLEDLQKKKMAELHSELKKKHFRRLKKGVTDWEKVEKAKLAPMQKEVKAALKKALDMAIKATKQGRGRGRARGGQQGGGRDSRANGAKRRGRGKAHDSSGDDSSPQSDSSDDVDEHPETTPNAITGDSSDEDGDGDEPRVDADAPEDEEDGDVSEGEEIEIVSFNGHRWESRRNLQFQVIWADGDVTWEPLASVNDCAAMESYLTHHDIDDPLQLSKRKCLIKGNLKTSNE
ncbi:hypothetical protein K438DRAFT_1764738 [Mycena galopus ATCC 62051]|nr:hypothetical protein K438DRAFT_1764738 [Mycena galopus ATCC 62051]